MEKTIYTIGHSSLTESQFLGLLEVHGITTLVDVRSFPGSRKHPHFGREVMQATVQAAGIDYLWLPALGGRRRPSKERIVPVDWWTYPGFAGYAEHALTYFEWIEALRTLYSIEGRVAYMCAEAQWWRCHRRIISDWLTANDVVVRHIMGAGEPGVHVLTEGARVGDAIGGFLTVTYPASTSQADHVDCCHDAG